MNDESTHAVVPDISIDNNNAVSTESSDSSESTSQPPLKKSTSNVPITLNIRYKTQIFSVKCDLYDTVKDLKEKLDKLTDIDPKVQKLVNKSIKSVKQDDAMITLKDLNLSDGQTLLLIGATRSEILATADMKNASSGSKRSMEDSELASNRKEPLCKQTKHEKVIKMGKPDNAQIGIVNKNDPLPASIDGLYMSMLNQPAKKARLMIKLEFDELWINTAETTKKIPMSQIRNIIDEPIEGFDGYSIVGFQIGTTENSIIWIYWCPSQYVKSIRREIMSYY